MTSLHRSDTDFFFKNARQREKCRKWGGEMACHGCCRNCEKDKKACPDYQERARAVRRAIYQARVKAAKKGQAEHRTPSNGRD
jgi:hypothetical protein